MYDILRTIEFLGGHISKNEIVSMKLQSFYNKMTKKNMILVTGITAINYPKVSAFCKYAKSS